MTDFRIDIEPMSDVFTKYHLRGDMPFNAVLHKFSDIDRGDPHSHPWGFRSVILHGSYVEEIYHPKKGLVRTLERKQGDSFVIKAKHIHRIVELPHGECWTMIIPGPWERDSDFWQFRDDGAYTRAWFETEWRKV